MDNGSSTALGARTAGDNRPDGFAVGRSGLIADTGLRIGTYNTAQNIQILSGGGDIFMAGQAAPTSTIRTGVTVVSGVVDASLGKVSIHGRLDSTAGTNYQRGVLFGYGGSDVSILSRNSASDAILIRGDASMTSGGWCRGVEVYETINPDLLIANEGSGGVQIIGDGCASTTTGGNEQDGVAPVSYTHLTLPTKRIV